MALERGDAERGVPVVVRRVDGGRRREQRAADLLPPRARRHVQRLQKKIYATLVRKKLATVSPFSAVSVTVFASNKKPSPF